MGMVVIGRAGARISTLGRGGWGSAVGRRAATGADNQGSRKRNGLWSAIDDLIKENEKYNEGYRCRLAALMLNSL